MKNNKAINFFLKADITFNNLVFIIVTPCLTLLAALWVPVVMKWGWFTNFFGLTIDGQYTSRGLILSFLVIGINAILICLRAISSGISRKYAKSSDEDISILKKRNAWLEVVNDSSNSLCKSKVQRQNNLLDKESTFKHYQVGEQIVETLKKLDADLSFMATQQGHRLDPKDLYVSLYYRFDSYSENEWRYYSSESPIGLNIDDLIAEGTTFHYLMKADSPNYIFYNSKHIASEYRVKKDNMAASLEPRYKIDSQDIFEEGRVVGSIIGYKSSIVFKRSKCVEFLIFVSTYGKKMLNFDDDIFLELETKTAKEIEAKINDKEMNRETIQKTQNNIKSFKSNVKETIEYYSDRLKIELQEQYLQEK